MKQAYTIQIILAILIFIAIPVYAQDENPAPVPDTAPELQGPGITATWELPGTGAGPLVVNPVDGSVWTFFHQNGTLVSMDGTTGEVLVEAEMSMRPTALAIPNCGSFICLAGEPLDDQVIDEGLVQFLDPSDGSMISEIKLEGACNAVYIADDCTVYVASGMQYGYQGNIYKLAYNQGSPDFKGLRVESQAVCGKVPWAIVVNDGVLYVTDLELQWTAQPDGSMGPPYGAYVWSYDSETLDFVDKCWVGINPNRIAVTDAGVLVGCSGSKQSEGDFKEPSLSLITSPGESTGIFIGTAGASDIDVHAEGDFAVVSLADWGPPASSSGVALYQAFNPGSFDDVYRWVYTGDIAVLDFGAGEPVVNRYTILEDAYIRSIALSVDGEKLYVLQDEPEKIVVVDLGF